ncbi:sigma-70 family RNA polymerase sigma factor [Achromobacter spanius]|uniref:sigma-70 family RNA polymerase sigma factor n=1 Tax=Achromobacter spanius TaxID=217203 RepID=UPI00320B2E07
MAVEKYYGELLRFLNRTLGNSHDAADVAHDACVRVLGRSPESVVEQPRAFLFKTAINLSVDLHRRRTRRECEPLHDDIASDGALTPDEDLYRKQQLELVHAALHSLPEACRTAFLLRQVEGLSHRCIAERLGTSTDMVKKHIARAMKHCRLYMRARQHRDPA